MRRWLLAILAIGLSPIAFGQQSASLVAVDAAPTFSCTSSVHKQVYVVRSTGEHWACVANTWSKVLGPFNAASSSCVNKDGDATCEVDAITPGAAGYLTLNPLETAIAVYDLDGNGTASSADLNGDGTADEFGIIAPAPMKVGTLWGADAMRQAPIYATNLSAIAQAWAHASLHGDPTYYLSAAVFDTYTRIFRGHGIRADWDRDGTAGSNGNDTPGQPATTLSQCWAGTAGCSQDVVIVCLATDPDGTTNVGYDSDSDGTVEFDMGDVFVVGSSTASPGRTHMITAINDGSDAVNGCPVGTDNQWTVAPGIDQNVECTAGNCAGQVITHAWKNELHWSDAAARRAGKELAYASRLSDGLQGSNLLRNGEADYDATVEAWVPSTGSLGSVAFATTPITSNFQCWEGPGANSCWFFNTATNGAYVESADAITVHPGERYVLSGWVLSRSGYTIALADDRDGDGTFAVSGDLTFTTAAPAIGNELSGLPGWWWSYYEIPEGVHRVKVRFTRADTSASFPLIDGWTLRRVTTWAVDDYDDAAKASFLINDPGDRPIVITGDSWATTGNGGTQFIAGLREGLEARFGRSLGANQVVLAGKAGNSMNGLMTTSGCTETSSSGGSLNCWYHSITKYDPLYAVIIMGTNDAASATVTSAQFVASSRQVAQRCRAEGRICVFVSPNPVQQESDSATFLDAHAFRDAQRRALLNASP